MERKRFDFICMESEEGRDALVVHGREHGLVDHCAGEHLLVRTSSGESRCWDFRDCEEITRGKEEFPWR
ncbi:MAG: hypothetical protein FDZ69_03400 [Deltaproteobacteria bacterium]|nr:MAG: hypothetical protein FDZ69_03400 [Deltaproteobacteria bacterium]